MVDDVYYSELQSRHLYDGLEEEISFGEESLIAGPAGPLELLASAPDFFDPCKPIAVVCHPHPLYGGSMSNKVVHALSDSFNDLGMLSVSFNFRGVGRSAGAFADGIGEVDDLLAVVNWCKARYPDAPIWLAGFSFGAFVAARAHKMAGAAKLLLVAPPVTLFDFSAVPAIEVPWMVIQGGRDEIIEPKAVSTWVHRQGNPPDYHWMADADHFFHGRMNRIKESVKLGWGAR